MQFIVGHSVWIPRSFNDRTVLWPGRVVAGSGAVQNKIESENNRMIEVDFMDGSSPKSFQNVEVRHDGFKHTHK